MKKLLGGLAVLSLIVFCQFIIVQAQTTGSIAGTVVDQNGAVVPNATVSVKGEGGQQFTVVTTDSGTFRVPAVAAGVYVVTITAPNFKKSLINNVKVDIGTPTTVDAALEVGSVEQVVEVSSGGEVLQTQTATVGTTITGRQITETPISSRDALDLILRLPGVAAVGAPRQSSINGLPKGAIQMSLDGVDDQDNVLRSSDGFFTFVRPRVDAIDEVTVSTANPGAESSGDGAVQVRFVTRRGNNNYEGSIYWQMRNTALNSAYWFNNRDLKPKPGFTKAPRDVIQLNQPGVRVGGPIPFPHFGEGGPMFHSGKNTAFFFVNYEQYRLPGSVARVRTILNPEAQAGTFNYLVNGATRTVNLFKIAGDAGFTNTIDPTVNNALNEIRAATATEGTITPIANDVNRKNYNFQNAANGFREFLAVRIDVNVTKNHSVEYIQNWQNFHPSIDTINGADQPFPGGTSYGQGGIRKTWTGAVRSTITRSIVNEGRFAVGGGGTAFNDGSGPQDYTSQGGYSLGVFAAAGVTALRAAASNNFSFRTTPTHDFTDNVTWLHGNHSISFGGQYKTIRTENTSVGRWVPSVGFGIDSTETALFNAFSNGDTGTLPGASSAQLTEARNLYAGLVGHVISYTNTGYLTADGVYAPAGTQLTSVGQTTYGLYAQDTWRMRPNLTINFGLRWQPQMGVINLSKNQSRLENQAQIWGLGGDGNLFRPGTFSGTAPRNVLLEIGEKIMPDDWNNYAPSVGAVWSPEFGEKGLLRKIFGSNGKTVFRGGYSMSFVREGLNVASQVVAGPGGTISLNRATTIPNSLTLGTDFRNGGTNLTPFNFNATPSFPLPLTTADQGFGVDAKLKTGVVHSFSFGIQREVDKNTVVEVRYVGNRGVDAQRLFNINERNTIENGVAQEFILAQQNLYANIQAGRCQGNFQDTNSLNPNFLANCRYNFAYFGQNTGTSPLPIALAYILGNPGGTNVATLTPGALGANGTVTSTGSGTVGNYTNALFRDMTTFAGLNRAATSVLGYASGLENNATRRANAVAAGLPSNFMFVNPTLPLGAFLLGNTQSSWYDSLVIEVRRRLSYGLRVQASYVFSKAQSDFFAVSSIVNSSYSLRPDGLKLAKTVQPFDLTHVFKLDTTYDIPVGRGKWLFSNAKGWVNSLLGGFSILPVVSWQSGAPIQIGNVQLVGMTVKELQKSVKVRYTDTKVLWLPDDIILNSQKAFDTLATSPTGYGTTFGTGGPTGRFLAPAGYNNCQQAYAGKCGFNNLVIYGPVFMKVDVGIAKRFSLGERRNIELKANILNALNSPNFKVGGYAVNTTGSGCCGGTFGEMTSASAAAYRDTNTTNDPGGRVIDIIMRFNF